jgi:hypothetical protein
MKGVQFITAESRSEASHYLRANEEIGNGKHGKDGCDNYGDGACDLSLMS